MNTGQLIRHLIDLKKSTPKFGTLPVYLDVGCCSSDRSFASATLVDGAVQIVGAEGDPKTANDLIKSLRALGAPADSSTFIDGGCERGEVTGVNVRATGTVREMLLTL